VLALRYQRVPICSVLPLYSQCKPRHLRSISMWDLVLVAAILSLSNLAAANGLSVSWEKGNWLKLQRVRKPGHIIRLTKQEPQCH